MRQQRWAVGLLLSLGLVAAAIRASLFLPAEAKAGLKGTIWLEPEVLAILPVEGAAWEHLRAGAREDCGPVELADQDSRKNVCIMAKALVFARTGEERYLGEVVRGLEEIADMDTYRGRALALGRNLAAYVIAADLVDLGARSPELDGRFRMKLRELLTTETSGAAASLVDCHERRPNNWGTHCGASRAAVAVYLDDPREVARTARVFKGFLGDRSSYAGFTFGGPYENRDHSWECDPEQPVGVNPRGCRKAGRNLDGVIPDDQRRGGSFEPSDWPPPRENYVWEALQGILAQAVILHNQGYDTWEWEDRAILRAVQWLHEVTDYPATGDDAWQPHVVNHYYGTSFPTSIPSRPGKNVGWTDWTHR